MAQVSQVQNVRENGGVGVYPSHTMPTTYQFNSINRVIKESTPDRGISHFWYDQLGRLILSQNELQKAPNLSSGAPLEYSFSKYDNSGRICEFGELHTQTTVTWQLAFNPYQYSQLISTSLKRIDVTKRYYDNKKFNISYSDFEQNNLRGRLSSVTYEDIDDGNDNTFESGVHFSYGIHGNTETILRENQLLDNSYLRFKKIAYTKSLVTGLPLAENYQKGMNDEFSHGFHYDLDLRIKEVETSYNGILTSKHIEYSYHSNDQTKRIEYGENGRKVQGVDFAYTLNGWLKGVNSNTLDANRDIGNDGQSGSINSNVCEDVFGYSINYYDGDYKTIGSIAPVNHFHLKTTGSDFAADSKSLYNGNIKSIVTSLGPTFTSGQSAIGKTFTYDQLQRIKKCKSWNSFDSTLNIWETNSAGAMQDFEVRYQYDDNGNLISLKRNGSSSLGMDMDDLTYHYVPESNKLTYVSDLVPSNAYSSDLDDQVQGNYKYDVLGNLIKDLSQEAESITWNTYGRIKSINRSTGSSMPNIYFHYSPDGFREVTVYKYPNGKEETYYFVRHESGSIISTYRMVNDSVYLVEQPIYGARRVGVFSSNNLVFDGTLEIEACDGIHINSGNFLYEMHNYQNSVLAVITDKPLYSCNDGAHIVSSEVISATEYYPFGMKIPGMQYGGHYSYGHQGQRLMNSSKSDIYSYGHRIYSPQLGRFFSQDPLRRLFPWNSPYVFSENKVIKYMEHEGLQTRPSLHGVGRPNSNYRKPPPGSHGHRHRYKPPTQKTRSVPKRDIDRGNADKPGHQPKPIKIPTPIVDGAPHQGGQRTRRNNVSTEGRVHSDPNPASSQVILEIMFEVFDPISKTTQRMSVRINAQELYLEEGFNSRTLKNYSQIKLDMGASAKNMQDAQKSWEDGLNAFVVSELGEAPTYPTAEEQEANPNAISEYHENYGIYVGRRMLLEIQYKQEHGKSPEEQLQEKGRLFIQRESEKGNVEKKEFIIREATVQEAEW
jgi:RHS repeat-associated protein